MTEEKKESSCDLDTIDLWHIFSRVFRNGKKLIELVLRNLSPEESAEFRSILSKIEIALSDQADR